MKRLIILLAAACILAGSLLGCSRERTDPLPEPSDAPSYTPNATEEPPQETPVPTVFYDARTQTLFVQGMQDYSELTVPDEAAKARVLEVRDDAFTLSAYLLILRETGWDQQAELPQMVQRIAESLRFLKHYLRENAGGAYPASAAELPIAVAIDRIETGYLADESQITLQYSDTGTHLEFLYLLALMSGNAIGWEQIGYAWYVGTCIDPYSNMEDAMTIVPELPYYSQCIAAGVDPENLSAGDYRKIYDACARVCFEKGLYHWGSFCESTPVTSESVFTRKDAKQPGDTQLSAFMAASFIAWLDDSCGFEQLSLFCFGQKSFDEAFGMDYESAYGAWREWIEQNYPASGTARQDPND